ncbi:hypothetical protein [Maribacter sp. 2304DJ31-5]|uniref:hypothetical protein n=1 Tax=Maribacter sp. 2304DJ31-5 TaxID=3386273 RepID=UPI0039BCEA1D
MCEKQQDDLFEMIDESYGSPEKLAKHLDLALEMLFYVEEDTFDRREVRSVVSALRTIISTLRQQD